MGAVGANVDPELTDPVELVVETATFVVTCAVALGCSELRSNVNFGFTFEAHVSPDVVEYCWPF
jgi:hypothetical protein